MWAGHRQKKPWCFSSHDRTGMKWSSFQQLRPIDPSDALHGSRFLYSTSKVGGQSPLITHSPRPQLVRNRTSDQYGAVVLFVGLCDHITMPLCISLIFLLYISRHDIIPPFFLVISLISNIHRGHLACCFPSLVSDGRTGRHLGKPEHQAWAFELWELIIPL